MAVGKTLKKTAKKVGSAAKKAVRGVGKALGIDGKGKKRTSRKKTASKR